MTSAPLAGLVVVYAGNFRPSHSTENHVRDAFTALGATVLRLQEDDPFAWDTLPYVGADLVLWTRTWSWTDHLDAAGEAIERHSSTPVIGYTLDRLWGLNRERIITGERRDPMLALADVVVTADGGHDELWVGAGIDHRWLPPAIARAEAERVGRPDPALANRLGFVGSWAGYHDEWPHRRDLVRWLRTRYGRDFSMWPAARGHAIRGQELSDLYASTPVLVGDSCLAGDAGFYWSDRIPETLGRGGFLIHPNVVGLADHFTPGEHLATWDIGEWDDLAATIDWWSTHHRDRERVAAAGRAHVLEHHLYEHRARALAGIVADL